MEKEIVLAFSREDAKKYGVNAALLLQEIKRKYFYWKSEGKLDKGGFFWCDMQAISDWLLLHRNTVGKLSDTLEDAGEIERKVSYRPGSTSVTTWWRVCTENVQPDSNSAGQPPMQRRVASYIKANTKADTVEDAQTKPSGQEDDELSSADGNREEGGRMKPEAILQKIRMLWRGSKNDLRRQKVDAISRLQDEFGLDDQTIIDGIEEIAKNPIYKFKDGHEFTETLTHLLVRTDLEEVAIKIVAKAEAKNSPKKKISEQIKHNTQLCY